MVKRIKALLVCGLLAVAILATGSFAVSAASRLPAPDGVSAVKESSDSDKVTVSWNPVAGAAQYEVVRSDGTARSVVGRTEKLWLDAALTDGVSLYAVRAVDAEGTLGNLSGFVSPLTKPVRTVFHYTFDEQESAADGVILDSSASGNDGIVKQVPNVSRETGIVEGAEGMGNVYRFNSTVIDTGYRMDFAYDFTFSADIYISKEWNGYRRIFDAALTQTNGGILLDVSPDRAFRIFCNTPSIWYGTVYTLPIETWTNIQLHYNADTRTVSVFADGVNIFENSFVSETGAASIHVGGDPQATEGGTFLGDMDNIKLTVGTKAADRMLFEQKEQIDFSETNAGIDTGISLDFTQMFTIEMDLYATQFNHLRIFDCTVDATHQFLLDVTPGQEFRFLTSTGWNGFGPYQLALEEWVNVAFTYLPNPQHVILYVNGDPIANYTLKQNPAELSPFANRLFIGSTPSRTEFFAGSMRNIKVYSDTYASTRHDGSSFEHSEELSFDTQYLNTGKYLDMTKDFSIKVDIYPTEFNYYRIMDCEDSIASTGVHGFLLDISPTGQLRLYSDAAGGNAYFSAEGSIPLNEWTTLEVKYEAEGKLMTIVADGAAVMSERLYRPFMPTNRPLRFGVDNIGSSIFRGKMKNISVTCEQPVEGEYVPGAKIFRNDGKVLDGNGIKSGVVLDFTKDVVLSVELNPSEYVPNHYHRIFSCSAGAAGFELDIDNGGNMRFLIAETDWRNAEGGLQLNEWVKITLRYDADTQTAIIYKNDTELFKASVAIPTSTAQLVFGAVSGNANSPEYLRGEMRNVYLYNEGAESYIDEYADQTTAMAVARSNALTALDEAFAGYSEGEYSEANWALIEGYYDTAKAGIEAVTDIANLPGDFVTTFTASADAVKTLVEEEEEAAAALAAKKTETIAALDEAFAGYSEGEYSEANWALIEGYYDTAKAGIEAVTDIANLPGDFVATFTASADAVKTLAEEEEEAAAALAAKKTETIAALDEAFAGYSEGDYSEANWALIEGYYDTAKAGIEAVIDIADLPGDFVTTFTASADAVEKTTGDPGDGTGCNCGTIFVGPGSNGGSKLGMLLISVACLAIGLLWKGRKSRAGK